MKRRPPRATRTDTLCPTRRSSDLHDGIIELPADAPVGTPFADYAGANDPVIDISITPNRQDCMGVRGLARDLAAAGLGTLKLLDVPVIAGAEIGRASCRERVCQYV